MNAKRIRRQVRKTTAQVLQNNVRLMWAKLCKLHWRERVRLAVMLVRGDADLDRAARKGRDHAD